MSERNGRAESRRPSAAEFRAEHLWMARAKRESLRHALASGVVVDAATIERYLDVIRLHEVTAEMADEFIALAVLVEEQTR